jgi:hypothetical protein
MVRWMCGVTLRNRRPSVELRERLGIECVAEVARRGRVGWFGHVEERIRVTGCQSVGSLRLRGKG